MLFFRFFLKIFAAAAAAGAPARRLDGPAARAPAAAAAAKFFEKKIEVNFCFSKKNSQKKNCRKILAEKIGRKFFAETKMVAEKAADRLCWCSAKKKCVRLAKISVS